MNLNALYNTEITIQIRDSAIVIGFRPKTVAVGFRFFNPQGEPITMYQMRYNQQVPLSGQPVDKDENPAPVDGVPTWTLSSPDFAKLENIAPDGLSATLVGIKPGSFQVNMNGDADLGEGVKPITTMLDVTLLPGEAVGFQMQTGEATDQPPVTTSTKKSK